MNILRVNVFYDDEGSFKKSLDEANIEYSHVLLYTTPPVEKDSIISVISSISEAMPWNTLANVIVAWINARSNRQVIITMEENTTFQAKGYSASEISKMLSKSVNVTVISNDKDIKSQPTK